MRRSPIWGFGRSPIKALIAAGLALATLTLVVFTVAAPAPPRSYADTGSFPLSCSPQVGPDASIASVTGDLPSMTIGQPFYLTNYQIFVSVSVADQQAIHAAGVTSISGEANSTIEATGATPATLNLSSIPWGPVSIPSSPTSALTIAIPATATKVGPFTATAQDVSLAQGGGYSATAAQVTITCSVPTPNPVIASGTAGSPSTTVQCQSDVNCRGVVSNATISATLTGKSTTAATVQVAIASETLDCGQGYTGAQDYINISASGYTGSSLTVTETVPYSATGAVGVCYSSSVPFVDSAGAMVTTGLLPQCSSVSNKAPCVVSTKVSRSGGRRRSPANSSTRTGEVTSKVKVCPGSGKSGSTTIVCKVGKGQTSHG